MPPIHKKGALFGIHQDSPVVSSHANTRDPHAYAKKKLAGFGDENSVGGPLAGKGLGLGLGAGATGKPNVLGTKTGVRNVLGNKSNGARPTSNVLPTKQNDPNGTEKATTVLGKMKPKSTNVGLGFGQSNVGGLGDKENPSSSSKTLGRTTTSRSTEGTRTIKSRLFGTVPPAAPFQTAASSTYSQTHIDKPIDRAARNAHRSSPIKTLLGIRVGSDRSNVQAGKKMGKRPASTSAGEPARRDMDEEEDEIYGRPVTRKPKKVDRAFASSPKVEQDVFRSKPTAKPTSAPFLPYTSTFGTPLMDGSAEPEAESDGFALPAFPVPLTGGLFGPNKVASAGTKISPVRGLLFGSRGKENVPPAGEELVIEANGVARGHRALGSVFELDLVRGNAQEVGTAPLSPRQSSRNERSSIHGLGFGFTPCRRTGGSSPMAARTHQRDASSASGINHFLPNSRSSSSNLADGVNGGSPFERAKITPLKQRSRKRLGGSGSGKAMVHKRGNSSVSSMTNHFLPAATSVSSGLGDVGEEMGAIETSPMAKAKVTPLKSRRKHVRQKSSLSRGFSFGGKGWSAMTPVGLGLEDISTSPVAPQVAGLGFGISEYADDQELCDGEEASSSTPSVWESASSKRTTSSLGSATKRFWNLDVQNEADEDDMDDHRLAEGFLTGSPVAKRHLDPRASLQLSPSVSLHGMLDPKAARLILCSLRLQIHGWVQTKPGEFQAPPPPARPRGKGKGKAFLF
jgi:hypothetical protein